MNLNLRESAQYMHIITAHARPRQTDGRTDGRTDRQTNIVAIPRRFGLTNASRAMNVKTRIYNFLNLCFCVETRIVYIVGLYQLCGNTVCESLGGQSCD